MGRLGGHRERQTDRQKANRKVAHLDSHLLVLSAVFQLKAKTVSRPKLTSSRNKAKAISAELLELNFGQIQWYFGQIQFFLQYKYKVLFFGKYSGISGNTVLF